MSLNINVTDKTLDKIKNLIIIIKIANYYYFCAKLNILFNFFFLIIN